MTTAVRLSCLRFHTANPWWYGTTAVRLSVVHGARLLLGAEHESGRRIHREPRRRAPVIEVEEPHGIPLHVIAWSIALAGDGVGVPIDAWFQSRWMSALASPALPAKASASLTLRSEPASPSTTCTLGASAP